VRELQLSASSFVVKLHTHTKIPTQTVSPTEARITHHRAASHKKTVLGVHEPDTLNSLRRKRPEHERKKPTPESARLQDQDPSNQAFHFHSAGKPKALLRSTLLSLHLLYIQLPLPPNPSFNRHIHCNYIFHDKF
jgi:hypothetical protein